MTAPTTTTLQDSERALADRIIELQETNAKLIEAICRLGGPFMLDPKHRGVCRECLQLVGDFEGTLIAHRPGCAVALAIVAIGEAQAEPAVTA